MTTIIISCPRSATGKIITGKTLYELREDIFYILIEKQSSLFENFNNIEFIHRLAFLTKIVVIRMK
jgi:hypothetical protein